MIILIEFASSSRPDYRALRGAGNVKMAVSGRKFFLFLNNEFEMEEPQRSLVNNISYAVLAEGIRSVGCIIYKVERISVENGLWRNFISDEEIRNLLMSSTSQMYLTGLNVTSLTSKQRKSRASLRIYLFESP